MSRGSPGQHKGWSSRGYLPHFDAGELVQAITFRLADSLPKAVFDDLKATASNDADLREKIETAIDGARGDCALRNPKSQLSFKAHFGVSTANVTDCWPGQSCPTMSMS
jgi:hypothetical protein